MFVAICCIPSRPNTFARQASMNSDGNNTIRQDNEPANAQATKKDTPVVEWTIPARKQAEQMKPEDCEGKDPIEYHEEHVRNHAQKNVPDASRARIRFALYLGQEIVAHCYLCVHSRTAHSGGQDPAEPEHITVTYKAKNRNIGTCHVYTKSCDGKL